MIPTLVWLAKWFIIMPTVLQLLPMMIMLQVESQSLLEELGVGRN
jgi:hypothetical protein